MRSRNGNNSLSLSIFSIIFLTSLVLNASEYLISYRYVVKNSILYNENFQISKAMQKCTGQVKESINISNDTNKTLKNLLSSLDSEFIDYIHKLGLDVDSSDITYNLSNSSTTILTLKTTCFKVDINENFVIIAPLK